MQSVTPLALEVVLNVQGEIQARMFEADRLRRQHVQRAKYEADQARVRYMLVDPNNRLVADTLEAQWNENSGCSRRPMMTVSNRSNSRPCA